MISRRNIVLSAVFATVCAAAILGDAPEVIRVALGVPFVLFLPGYVLTSALFARRGIRRADVGLLSLAFSAAIVVIGTLFLNWLPWGLTSTTWTGLLLTVTLVASAWALLATRVDDSESSLAPRTTLRQALSLAFARRGNVPELTLALVVSVFVIGTLIGWFPWSPTAPTRQAFLIGAAVVSALWALLALRVNKALKSSAALQTMLRNVLLVALALVIGAGAIFLALKPLPAKGVSGYTALWILPGPSSSHTVVVGIQSSELHPTSYRLSVRSNADQEVDRRLTLQPGQRWTQRFPVGRSSRRVEAQLFRSRSPGQVYRRVRLALEPHELRSSTPAS